MEVIINDLEDLKKYIKVSKTKKEIFLKFDDVTFNCSLPRKGTFNYFLEGSISDYTVTIKGNKIVFNYYAECDNVYANNVTVKDVLKCKLLNVIGQTSGGFVSTKIFIGQDVDVDRLVVKKIVCSQISATLLTIDEDEYPYIVASSINNVEA